LVRPLLSLRLQRFQAHHLLLEPFDLFLQPRRLHGLGQRRLLTVGAVELVQITRHAFFDLRHAPLHLGVREIAVPVVDRLELRAVNRNDRRGQKTKPATEHHELRANLADRRPRFQGN
jgi:hypothetical protein